MAVLTSLRSSHLSRPTPNMNKSVINLNSPTAIANKQTTYSFPLSVFYVNVLFRLPYSTTLSNIQRDDRLIMMCTTSDNVTNDDKSQAFSKALLVLPIICALVAFAVILRCYLFTLSSSTNLQMEKNLHWKSIILTITYMNT